MEVSGFRTGLWGLMWRVIKEGGRGGREVIDHISWTINSIFHVSREKKNVFMRSVFLSLD